MDLKTKILINKNELGFIYSDKDLIELLSDLDDINRELVWLITGERPVANKTLFGKVLRAVQSKKNIKLKEKNKHSCDVYKLEPYHNGMKVFEFCNRNRAPELLAQVFWGLSESKLVEQNKKGTQVKVRFKFYGQNLADIIGIRASLVSPEIHCEVKLENKAKLQKLICEKFKYSRGEDVIDLKEFKFDRALKQPISLSGVILRNMLPFSQLQVEITDGGKIKVREIKLVPDYDEIDPKVAKNKKTKQEVKRTEPTESKGTEPIISGNPSTVPNQSQPDLRSQEVIPIDPTIQQTGTLPEAEMIEIKNENEQKDINKENKLYEENGFEKTK